MRSRLAFASLAALLAVVPAPAARPGTTARVGLSAAQVDALATKLLAQTRYPFRGSVVVDAGASGGYAAIRFQGNDSVIFVDPTRLATTDENTFAFVIGHELSHQAFGHGPASPRPQAEWDADVNGAKMARAAGYDLERYVRHLYRMPESCSPTHGCWHGRARNLERVFGLETGLWRDAHAGHGAATGFPPSQGPRVPGFLAVPCSHPQHPFGDIGPFGRTPCMHPVHASDALIAF